MFLLALLLFGPEQLPKLARQLGDWMRHVQSTTQAFMREMERAAEVGEVQAHRDEPQPVSGEPLPDTVDGQPDQLADKP